MPRNDFHSIPIVTGMNHVHRRVFGIALILFLNAVATLGAETKALRIAVGPFFAPVGNNQLRQASQTLPEMLVAELSHMSRFQLVEREKAQAAWSEYNLTASGLVSRETVAKLGYVLTCDWLISGSLVQASNRIYVWTKVIDVRSGVVVDLNASTYDASNITKCVAEIAAFLEKAGLQTKARQFIAMGPFVDMNPPLAQKREDWSRRIPALLEKRLIEAGFGIVELAAVGPIFEERRLETAGLTGIPDGRVKLQAAFWLIDGGCEWVSTNANQLGVGLRIQKVGAPEQIFRITDSAGIEIERAVIATVQRALTNSNFTAAPSPNAEADLLLARSMELATRRSPFEPKMSTAKIKTQRDSYNELQEGRKHDIDNRNSAIATYERTLLRDPNNFEAKTWLGFALIGDPQPANRERGKELLREVVASGSQVHAQRAKHYLERADEFARAGDEMAAPPKRPDDWISLNQAVAENPKDMEAKCDLGAAMLKLPRASNREQGRKLLNEVIVGDRPDQAERARKLLAEPELTPAVTDSSLQSVSQSARNSSKKSAPPIFEPEKAEERGRREFLQKNFASFTPVQFEKEDPDLARIQRLDVKATRLEYQGQFYSGFRFTTPDWFDGNFYWTYLLAKSEAQKDFSTKDFEWYIVAKSGRMNGFKNFSRYSISSYAKLRERFPNTSTGLLQTLPKDCLEPGQEYAIWFAYKDLNLPDIAFSMTLQSERGRIQYGTLPLR